jgi:hypothetical protein
MLGQWQWCDEALKTADILLDDDTYLKRSMAASRPSQHPSSPRPPFWQFSTRPSLPRWAYFLTLQYIFVLISKNVFLLWCSFLVAWSLTIRRCRLWFISFSPCLRVGKMPLDHRPLPLDHRTFTLDQRSLPLESPPIALFGLEQESNLL